MALTSTDLFYVQRPSGGDAGNYKMQAGDLIDFIASSPAVQYRGTVDCTLPVGAQLDPNPPTLGDLYINTGTGTVDATGTTSADAWVGMVMLSLKDSALSLMALAGRLLVKLQVVASKP